MKRFQLIALAAMMGCGAASSQTILSFNAGTDGVNVGVATLLDAYPLTVVTPPPPPPPRPHRHAVVHIPMRPGYVYDAPPAHFRKHKPPKQFRKAVPAPEWVRHSAPRPHRSPKALRQAPTHHKQPGNHGHGHTPMPQKHHDKHKKPHGNPHGNHGPHGNRHHR